MWNHQLLGSLRTWCQFASYSCVCSKLIILICSEEREVCYCWSFCSFGNIPSISWPSSDAFLSVMAFAKKNFENLCHSLLSRAVILCTTNWYFVFQEFQENNRELVIAKPSVSQTVYIYCCKNSTIQVKGKINSLVVGKS